MKNDPRPINLDENVREMLLERPSPGAVQPVAPGVPANSDVVVERASMEERMLYVLEERLAELDMRLREQLEANQVRELEFRAIERDLLMKEAYVTTLETERNALAARSHELFVALEAMRADRDLHLANETAIQNQLTYRVARKAATVLRENTGPLYGLLKTALRAAAR
ncbi:MAG TPA: hypothetical protein VG368_00375 [Acidimicrobiales bacterium]|nr:hypothetical protein [Acidimicrobiales bacterium]